jgi:protein translocase, SecG subunit
MANIIPIVQIVISAAIIGLVLLQQRGGGGLGGAFGQSGGAYSTQRGVQKKYSAPRSSWRLSSSAWQSTTYFKNNFQTPIFNDSIYQTKCEFVFCLKIVRRRRTRPLAEKLKIAKRINEVSFARSMEAIF